MSIDIRYIKNLIIDNQSDRDPLPKGFLFVEFEFMTDALDYVSCKLHQFEPLQVIDKVGFLKSGDDAAELLLDALQQHLKNELANGAQFNFKVGPTVNASTP